HVRGSEVAVHDCVGRSPRGAYTQGIDISFGLEQPMSLVEGCTVTGGAEGIVTHYANAMVSRNRVSGTSLRAITLTEMSMGMAERNDVDRALGIGILCGDHSLCELAGNKVSGSGPIAPRRTRRAWATRSCRSSAPRRSCTASTRQAGSRLSCAARSSGADALLPRRRYGAATLRGSISSLDRWRRSCGKPRSTGPRPDRDPDP